MNAAFLQDVLLVKFAGRVLFNDSEYYKLFTPLAVIKPLKKEYRQQSDWPLRTEFLLALRRTKDEIASERTKFLGNQPQSNSPGSEIYEEVATVQKTIVLTRTWPNLKMFDGPDFEELLKDSLELLERLAEAQVVFEREFCMDSSV